MTSRKITVSQLFSGDALGFKAARKAAGRSETPTPGFTKAHPALTRAVNRAIEEGAPVYVNVPPPKRSEQE